MVCGYSNYMNHLLLNVNREKTEGHMGISPTNHPFKGKIVWSNKAMKTKNVIGQKLE